MVHFPRIVSSVKLWNGLGRKGSQRSSHSSFGVLWRGRSWCPSWYPAGTMLQDGALSSLSCYLGALHCPLPPTKTHLDETQSWRPQAGIPQLT